MLMSCPPFRGCPLLLGESPNSLAQHIRPTELLPSSPQGPLLQASQPTCQSSVTFALPHFPASAPPPLPHLPAPTSQDWIRIPSGKESLFIWYLFPLHPLPPPTSDSVQTSAPSPKPALNPGGEGKPLPCSTFCHNTHHLTSQ